MQLLQFDQHGSLVLVLPQSAVSDQPAVVIQRAAVAGGVQPAVLLHLLGFGWETLRTKTASTLTCLGLWVFKFGLGYQNPWDQRLARRWTIPAAGRDTSWIKSHGGSVGRHGHNLKRKTSTQERKDRQICLFTSWIGRLPGHRTDRQTARNERVIDNNHWKLASPRVQTPDRDSRSFLE